MSNKTPDIGLYPLQLLRLVAEARSFTSAAQVAGISQSAISRQIQSVELELGIKVLDRTTRKVSLTEAGAILLRETEPIPNILAGAVRRIEEECLCARKEIRIGISSELVLAHIPGLFHAHQCSEEQRSEQRAKLVVSQDSEVDLLESTRSNHLDVAIVTKPKALPQTVEVIHDMEDQFCIITSGISKSPAPEELSVGSREWAGFQDWLFPSVETESRCIIDKWITSQNWKVRPVMELDDFDLMIQFVALGMGSAIIPRRACSVFQRKHLLQKVEMPKPLSRRLVAIVPRFSRPPEHVKKFVEGLLFS
ncbi:LysR family transcriptional regulator [Haloferula sp.]|uniref:LysR family transcriptional regulator n=1 Tax=Haloferula sp. TaxID=2497595 RepID=UPI00329EDFC4